MPAPFDRLRRLLGASHDARRAAEGGVDAELARKGLDARAVDGRVAHDVLGQPLDVADLLLLPQRCRQ